MASEKMEIRTLHFDLEHAESDIEFSLHVGAKKYSLTKHTPDSLHKFKSQNSTLGIIPEHKLTHYIEGLSLPAKNAQMLLITCPSKMKGSKLDTLVFSCIHVPESSRRKALETKNMELYHEHKAMPHPKLAMCGVHLTAQEEQQAIIDVHDWKTAMDAAVSIVFHHGELLNVGGDSAAVVLDIIEYSNGISDLAQSILDQSMAHRKDPSVDNWVKEEPYRNPDGTPVQGTSRYKWTDTTMQWMVNPLKDSLKKAKNDPRLLSTEKTAGNYTVQKGVTSVSTPQETVRVNLSESDDYWTLNCLTPKNGYSNEGGIEFKDGVFSTEFKNSWLRWLSVYVEFLGPSGATVVPEKWKSCLKPYLAGIYDHPTTKYAEIIPAVDTMLAIPLISEPVKISFEWPSNASAVRILSGGIGRTGGIQGEDGRYYGGWNPQVCTAGAIMTGFFNFGIPATCLLMGVSVSFLELNEIAKIAFETILEVAKVLIDGPLAGSLTGGDITRIMIAFADIIPHLLLEAVVLATWMTEKIGEGSVEASTPIFGWIAMAFSAISDIALLTQTSVEVALSPATFEYVATRAIDAEWTLLPDPEHQNTWPRQADHYEVIATYMDGTTRKTSGKMTGSPQTGSIIVYFDKANDNRLPAGGMVMFIANFYSKTNWLCGNASTDYINANIKGNKLTIPQKSIHETLVPLTRTTTYEYNSTLVYNTNKKSHEWSKVGGSPKATIKDLSASPIGNNLASLVGITVSQNTSQLGYVWQASGQNIPVKGQGVDFSGQAFTFQAIDVRDNPESALRFGPMGFTTKPLLMFDIKGSSKGLGNNFFIDPRDNAYHLRQVILDGKPGSFDMSGKVSWGKFNQQLDSCVIHPSGYAAGISTAHHKLEILKLPKAGLSNADAPLADMYCGYGSREGLLHNPVGIAATPNAGVIVLESYDPIAKPRMQAFDLYGNPTPIFANKSTIVEFPDKGKNATYLDIAVEGKGFIYILKYFGDGSLPDHYWVDIYNPDGTLLTQSPGISASKMTVDLWRTLYTLNFQKIIKPNGERTEPSVSIWLPTA